ncbi:MAG: hypothetical protein M3Q10_06745, partial [Chloroflexota bacterium]|nr:hypothetical protein [Chloroflexota bacterium]
MRAATVLETSRRLARRELVLGGFTFLMAVVGLASLAAVAVAGTAGGLDRGGATNGGDAGGPRLVAVGHGEAGAPAEVATLQLLIGPSSFDTPYIGGAPTGASVPGEAERAAVQPLVDALQAAGVAPAAVVVHVSPAFNSGYYGPSSASVYGVRVDATVHQPSLEKLNALVHVAGGAAAEHRFSLPEIGVAYGVADCAPVLRQARERAIEDARRNAGDQA